MTTNNDNKELTYSISGGLAAPQGLSSTGFQDATANWPRESHFFSQNFSKAASLSSDVHQLYTGGADAGVPLDLGEAVPPKYPYNQVSETVSGHVIEVNDTPGGERILIKHRSGAGVELMPDGTVLFVSTKNMIQISGADQTVIIDGEANLVYKGNLNLKVSGDLNIDVGGNYNLTTKGNKTETTIGSDRKSVTGNVGETVTGASSSTVLGPVTNTYLGNLTTSVKGNLANQASGDATYVANGTTTMTSGTKMNMSSTDVNISGSSLSVFGDAGTVGGENVVAYVKNIYGVSGTFTEGFKAPTFEGKLKGKADDACKADYATTAGQAPLGSAGAAGTQSHTAVNTVATALPNGANVTDYLTNSANGIRRVQIDPGDFIKNTIDKSTAYSGVASHTLSTTEARSVLRDPANAQLAGTLMSEQTVSPNYYNAAPQGVGRVVNGGPTPSFGQTPIGQGQGQARVSDAVIPRRGKVNIIPDPRYNPMWAKQITSATKLAPGITITKFLAGNGDTATLNFISSQDQRKQIAKHLYLHAEIMRSIQTNKGLFANLRVGVAEGMYKPGPTEKVTANSINDLKMKGRAVVYELYDSTGNVSNSNTFDLAVYWKDTILYDKMILSYDMIEGKIKAQIIVILPQISDDWSGTFGYSIETHFNGKIVSTGELVECLASSSRSSSVGGTGNGPAGSNGNLDSTTLVSIGGGHKLRGDAAAAYNQMALAASRDGVTWSITDSYRDYATQVRLAEEKGLYSQGGLAATPGTSNHGWGLAVDLGGGANNSGTSQNNWLVANASRFGFFTIPREPWHWEYRGVGV